MHIIPNNPVRAALRQGKKVSAAWLHAASNITAEVIARSGFDAAVVDMEHAPGDFVRLVGQIQAMQGHPAVPFVRAPWNDFVQIKRILDAGAYGLLVPYINTRAEAEAAVAAALYPPSGIRGIAGSTRAGYYGMNPKEYFCRANDEICILAQVETPAAIANLDDILKVERLDGIVIGPLDLATGMGHFADPGAKEVQDAIRRIEEKVLAAGKALSTVASGWEDASEKYRRGYSMIIMMSDTVSLGQLAKNLVASFRKEYA